MAVSKFLDPKNDIAFKKIFGSEKHKDILIHFINDIMGFGEAERISQVTFLSPVQDPEVAYQKQSIVDVLCQAQDGTQIIVEMQVSPQAGFEKRAQYYAAKAYSRQLHRGQGEEGLYANLKAVIFIAISEYKIFPQKAAYLSHHVILDQQSYEQDLKDFSFSFIELPKFPIERIEELQTIIEKWCFFFKYAAKTSEADLERLIGSDLVIKRAYEALNQFNWQKSELLAYEQEIKRVLDNRAAEAYQQQLVEQAEAKAKQAEAKVDQAEAKVDQAEAKVEQAEAKVEQAKAKVEQAEAKAKQAEAKGLTEKSYEIAAKMLAANFEPRLISTLTGLSLDDILSLQKPLEPG